MSGRRSHPQKMRLLVITNTPDAIAVILIISDLMASPKATVSTGIERGGRIDVREDRLVIRLNSVDGEDLRQTRM